MTFRSMSERHAQLRAAYAARREPQRPITGLGEWLQHNRAVTARKRACAAQLVSGREFLYTAD